MKSGSVGILGWTNVGKSTLMNRLVGEKIAAVADVAQTTRHQILGVLHLPKVGQIVFVDTPGLHEPRLRMNRAMVDAVHRSLAGVDLALLVVDAARGLGRGDEEAARVIRKAAVPALAVLNKTDLVVPKARLLPMMKLLVEGWGCEEAIPVSARTGEGCDRLVASLAARLPEGEPAFPEDALTDQPERLLAAEWIREKILHHTRQEIPHASAVLVDRWREREDGVVEIDALVLVERESQKGIVIGKGGHLLKTVGSEARADIEKLLGRRVGLRIRVEVREAWRNDVRTLRELGLA